MKIEINLKQKYNVNQHFPEAIPTLDPWSPLRINVAWFLHCNRKGLTIVSDYHKLQEEILKLISVLKQNGYAKWFFFTKYRPSLPLILKIH